MSIILLGFSATACNGSETKPSPSTSTSTLPAVPQDKYTGTFPSCKELAGKVPGLPPLLTQNDQPMGVDHDKYCEFGTPGTGPWVTMHMSSWKSDPTDLRFPPGVSRGQYLAKGRFASNTDPVDDGAAQDLQLGEQAKWQRPRNNDGCYLTILDGNAVFRFRYALFGETNLDPRSEQCRGALRDVAKPIYAAIQPR